MHSCLNSCGDWERVERARLEADRHEEVPRALRRPLRHRRRPHVDEAHVVHRTADRRDHDVVEAEVALHALAPHVEPPVLQAEHVVDVVADLERQRRRARQDLQRLDLDLDLARRQVRVHGLRRALDDFALRLEHELVAHVVRDLRRLGRMLRVDDELHLAAEVAQVDEHEPAVVAARVRPAGDRHARADVGRSQRAAGRVAPAAHTSSSV